MKDSLDIRMPVATSFTFDDERPYDADYATRYEEGEDAVAVLGDLDFAVKPPDLLRATLQHEAGAKLHGRRVTLKRFRVEVRTPADAPPTIAQIADNPAIKSQAVVNPVATLLALPVIGTIESVRVKNIVRITMALSVDGVLLADEFSQTYRGQLQQEEIDSTLQEAVHRMIGKVVAL